MLVLHHFDQLCFTRWHRRRNDLLGQAPVLLRPRSFQLTEEGKFVLLLA